MIVIRFANAETERRALGFLAGRFSFTTKATGETLVPPAALAALAREKFAYSVEGPASYEQLVPTLRDSAATVSQ
jgi:hypothetical protein